MLYFLVINKVVIIFIIIIIFGISDGTVAV